MRDFHFLLVAICHCRPGVHALLATLGHERAVVSDLPILQRNRVDLWARPILDPLLQTLQDARICGRSPVFLCSGFLHVFDVCQVRTVSFDEKQR